MYKKIGIISERKVPSPKINILEEHINPDCTDHEDTSYKILLEFFCQ